MKTYERLVEHGKADAEIWLGAGHLLSECGECAQAIGAFANSIEENESSAEAHHSLARACYKVGEVSRAAEHLETAIKLSDSINSWQSLTTLLPGWPECDQKRLIETRRKFTRKLAAHTGTPWPTDSDRPHPKPHDGR